MKLTKIYTAILNGIGLIVKGEEIKTSLDETVTMQVKGKEEVKKLPMLIPTKDSVRAVEPGDIVRFHPLGESIFADISAVNQRFSTLMASDISLRMVLLGEKIIEEASNKESDISPGIHKLTNGINVTGVSAKYWKAVIRAGLTKHGITSLFRIDNVRSKELDGIKYSRVCQITSNIFSATPDVGFFGVKPANDKHFAMVMLVLKRILGPILIAKGSNIKSAPTFISMLEVLIEVNKNINKMAKALYRSSENACHRDISWGKEIDGLPEIYVKELNVTYKHNGGDNAKIKVKKVPVTVPEETKAVKEEKPKGLMSDVLEKPATEEKPEIKESPKPIIISPDDPSITGVQKPLPEQMAQVSAQTISQQIAVPTQETKPMIDLFEGQALTLEQQGIQVQRPTKMLGAPQEQVQQQTVINGQAQTFAQATNVVSQPMANMAQGTMQTANGLPMVIVGADTSKVTEKRQAVDMGDTVSGDREAVSVKQVNECHAIDAHRQPLFYADGEPYIIKGRNAKLPMIHAQNQNGAWQFGPDGSPVLTAPTMAADGSVKGIKGTGVAGGVQQANAQGIAQDPNSLAARLNGAANNNTVFATQLGGNALSQPQQQRLNGGTVQQQLNAQDLATVYEHLKFLVSKQGLPLQQGQKVELMIQNGSLTLEIAKRIIQASTQLRQRLQGGSQLGGGQLGVSQLGVSQLGGRQGTNLNQSETTVEIGGWD